MPHLASAGGCLIMASIWTPLFRLEKELDALVNAQNDPTKPIRLHGVEPETSSWFLRIQGAEGTLYRDESFLVRFSFTEGYVSTCSRDRHELCAAH
eukprot:Protomagalhaensia_sp_Gyna_25__3605@NODE_323_length_3878_cov_226_857254_g253_i0_p4_GENE_NODE_323_length_3878_cov_226_857254_g253_i0NODE_323_length_3878_cov_226_857254_g253_i0_p4_ORF_typecomplete_len106_score1_10UQ_con/PF00179_26/4_2e05_NODE_323_length_3878_cov_226_857254_g253_i032319